MLNRILRSGWTPVVILAVAVLVRVLNLSHWSLWEDEEGSIYFSQRPERAFARAFPVFFLALRGLLSATDLSVGSARLLSCAVGITTVLLLLVCFQKLLPKEVRALAALLLALNLGHVFWSQSVRYYTTVLLLQLLSMHWFLDGFEFNRRRSLVLSNVAFAVAMLTHFSAALLAPVYVAYLAIIVWKRDTSAFYTRRNLLIFCVPLGLILAFFAYGLLQMQKMLSGYGMPSARDPVHVLATLVAYFGVPVIVLGIVAAFIGRRLAPRVHLFFTIVAILPVLELATIAILNMINVTWYYGFFSLIGFAVLSAALITELAESGRTVLANGLVLLMLVYCGAFLGIYHTVSHGDRPRWDEALAYLKDRARIDPRAEDNPEVFGTITQLPAFYLGVNPARTMESQLVHYLPATPPRDLPAEEQWFVLERRVASPAYLRWLEQRATLEAKYDAFTGPIDRTVVVYHYDPSKGRASAERPYR